MISDLNLLLNHYDSIVCDLICKLCTHIIAWIQRPQSDNNWDNHRGWLWCEDHMCSWSVNALLWCSIKRNILIASSSLEAPLPRVGWTKDVVQVLIASTYDYLWSTCLGLFSTWMLVIIYLQCPTYMKGVRFISFNSAQINFLFFPTVDAYSNLQCSPFAYKSPPMRKP